MVADGVHVLLGPALVMLLLRTDRAEPYLVAMLFAGIPDLDRYLFSPLITGGYLAGPLWAHRGITHSLLVMALFVYLAYLVGQTRAGAIGYGSHLAADFLTGNIRLLAPFDVTAYGLGYDWLLGSTVAGAFSGVVLITGVAMMAHRERVDRFRVDLRRRVRALEWRLRWWRGDGARNAPQIDRTESDGD